MSDTHDIPEAQDTLEPPLGFDERRFLRAVRLKSASRVLLIAGILVALSWATAFLGMDRWSAVTMREAVRIDRYYADFVAVTNPNTWILGDSVTRLHFPGASNDYASFRLIGGRPVPAGVRSVDFGAWSVEYPRGYDERLTGSGDRIFSGNELIPELRIVHPGARDDTYLDESGLRARDIIGEFDRITDESLARLASTPPSYTAEVAFSFDRLLTLEELLSFAGPETTLAWGAVSVWEPTDMPPLPLINAGSMVGVPFAAPDITFGSVGHKTPEGAEEQLPKTLRNIATLSKLSVASRALDAAEVIERDGVRYYGVVLTGPPAAMLKLAEDSHVTGVCYGLSVGVWE